jgi:outer membrane protein assembly factor BamD
MGVASLMGGLGLCLLAFPGCSSTSKAANTGTKVVTKTDEQIFIGDTIEKNFDPNVILKRGEAFFEKEEYPEAIVEYQHFVDLHRSHTLAPYAQFRQAEAHMKMAKTIDRDPDPINKAIATFERLRRDFPGSRYESAALEKIQECHDWLAQAHLFVGQFYYRRGSYLAAAHRFELIMQQYPDKQVAPEALYYLAKSYEDLGAKDWAEDKLILLAEQYPKSELASEGRKLLAKSGGKRPAVAQADGIKPSPEQTARPEPAPVLSAAATVLPNGHSALQPNGQSTLGTNGHSTLQPNGHSNGHMPGVRIPTAAAGLTSSYISCRIGAWC